MNKKIHFVGIGGIGVSGLANYFLAKNSIVTGSDLSINESIEKLREKGAKIYKGHNENNVDDDCDLVIYSPAIPKENPELEKARRKDIEVLSYPEALGRLTKKHFTIAVSGTHGKSTTTCMIALMMIEAGLDPTVIVGTKLDQFGNSNYRTGSSKYLVIEADEWKGSLLNYSPNIITLTNLEKEHLDYYSNLSNLLQTFQKYINNLKEGGAVVYNDEDENLKKINLPANSLSFSKKLKVAKEVKSYLKVPGEHNLENALAAYQVGKVLKINKSVRLTGLSHYKGAWRRFEEKIICVDGRDQKIVLDYAHHPTELTATLNGLREKYPEKNIVTVFQPHQFQRSYYLKDKFVEAFNNSKVDKLIVTDIYSVPGRENKKIKKKISSEKLANKTNADYFDGTLKDLSSKLKNDLRGDDIIAIIGAGDIYKLESLLKENGN